MHAKYYINLNCLIIHHYIQHTSYIHNNNTVSNVNGEDVSLARTIGEFESLFRKLQNVWKIYAVELLENDFIVYSITNDIVLI